MYRAKFAFDGQADEMSLNKDDLVELIEKDNNGWWLVKKDGREGWAPNNYLELVPPKPKAAQAPPPPPNRRPPPTTPAEPVQVSSKPVSKPSTPVAGKPKPPAPAIGTKPATAPKPGIKPPIPTAPRPGPAASNRVAANKPATSVGQLDLAAAVSTYY
jgi:myosin I